MLLPTLEQIQKKENRNYTIKVYIEDNNYEWVDFTSRVKKRSDLVLEIPNIKRNADSRFISSSFSSSAGSLNVDNSDGFWDASLDFTMKTEKGNTASFSQTKNKSETVWCRRRIQFRIIESFKDQHFENSVGTFLIDEIETSLSPTATLKLVGLEKPLMERDASVVKNGQTWYQNRSVSFLVKKLLEIEYTKRNNGRLPDTFKILDRINLSTYDGGKTNSVIGPPPMEVDTDGDGISNISLDNTKRTRAICLAPATISSATKDDAKNTLYLGCDEQLYSYNPNTDLFTELTNISDLGDGYFIRYLWFSQNGTIFGVAYPDLETSGSFTWNEWTTITAKIFEYENNSITVLKTITSFYDGTKYYRDGHTHQATVTFTYLGQIYISDTAGPNVLCPFSQYVRRRAGGGTWKKYKKYDLADDNSSGLMDAFADEDDLPENLDGFNVLIFKDSGEILDVDAGVRLSLGQQGCISFNDFLEDTAYTKGAILYCKVSGVTGSDQFDMYLFNLNTLTETKITSSPLTIDIEGDTYRASPISACYKKNTRHGTGIITTSRAGFYLGLVAFAEAYDPDGDWDYIESEIRYYNVFLGTWTTVGNYDHSYAARRGKVPIELFYNNPSTSDVDNDEELFVSFIDYFYLSSIENRPRYEIKKYTYNFSSEVSVYKTNNQPKGINIREEDTTKDLYFVSQQTGYINKLDLNTNNNLVLDSGFPIVDNNTFLSSQLIFDDENRENDFIIWGLASDSFDYQMTVSASFSYLFKYDSVISEYIQLADFEALSVWDALGLLAQRSNCIMGFDTKGDFFFQKREISDDYKEIGYKDNVSIKKERGMDNVFNFVEITPYEVNFQQPEYEASIKDRSDEEKEETVLEEEIIIRQLDTKTKEIALFCVTDGDANMGAASTNGFPLFKYRIYEIVIHGFFTTSVTASSILNVSSTFGGENNDFGIKTGYFLVHTDENEEEEYYKIEVVDSETNEITIDDSISVNKGDEFTIVRRNKIYDSIKDWSDEGVTFITTGTTGTEHVVNSLDALSVETYIMVNNQYVRITNIDSDTRTITVDSSITTITNNTVYAFFAPRVYSYFYEIGNTNVYLKIGTSGNRSIFKQGDRIVVKCTGLIIESDENSKQIAINSTSTNLYGKKQYPNINNKFLTRKLSKQMANKIRTLYAFPKYILTLTLPLYTFIDIINSSEELTTLAVRSKKLFPYRDGFTEKCYITSINHNFKTLLTQVEVIAYEAY